MQSGTVHISNESFHLPNELRALALRYCNPASNHGHVSVGVEILKGIIKCSLKLIQETYPDDNGVVSGGTIGRTGSIEASGEIDVHTLAAFNLWFCPERTLRDSDRRWGTLKNMSAAVQCCH